MISKVAICLFAVLAGNTTVLAHAPLLQAGFWPPLHQISSVRHRPTGANNSQ